VQTLQRVYAQDWQNSPILTCYVNDLAKKPYCTDEKGYCHIRSKAHAIQHIYIQPNQPARASYIVIDIDHSNAALQWYDSDLPPPHIIIQNPQNNHAHIVYKLHSPVFMWGKAKSAPIRLLARVERGLTKALLGDIGYGGNLMKNPINDAWYTYTTNAPIEGYSLEHLGRFVSLDFIPTTDDSEASGYGRNCTLFDHVRHYGYNLASNSYEAIVRDLKPIADQYNQQFAAPLFDNEVMHIVRSIARYCSKTDFTASHEAFSELQRHRVIQRWGDNTEKRIQAQKWASEGVKIKVIAERLGVTARTLTNWGLRKKKK
jgi:hypothetical protein